MAVLFHSIKRYFLMGSEKDDRGRIQVYVRIRPPGANKAIEKSTGDYKEFFSIDPLNNILRLKLPKAIVGETSGEQINELECKFREIFDADATQETVFRDLAVPVLRDVLDGYNATIFAYGQTGSGKCLGLGTKVLMSDGLRCKRVEELRIGDKILGYEDKGYVERTILNVTDGEDDMYEVHTYLQIENCDDPLDLYFTCNSEHLLAYHSANEDTIRWKPAKDYMDDPQCVVSPQLCHFGVVDKETLVNSTESCVSDRIQELFNSVAGGSDTVMVSRSQAVELFPLLWRSGITADLESTTTPQCNNTIDNDKPTLRVKNIRSQRVGSNTLLLLPPAVIKAAAHNKYRGFTLDGNGLFFLSTGVLTHNTYTMTGGGGLYRERGIMPRSLEMLFKEASSMESTGRECELWISYLQIYFDVGYDLLGVNSTRSGSDAMKLEDLPKVQFLEDGEGILHSKNLSSHRATTIDEALNILWTGDLNRVVTATLQNESSSRSHCVFTIYVRSHEIGSDVFRTSKLNFVDLAGSERVARTGAEGDTLQQAKYINVSLFHLERVIHALATRSSLRKQHQQYAHIHIPYRDSLLTLLLRDSLGGNCLTTLISTISPELMYLGDSASTLSFSKRVASLFLAQPIHANEKVDLRTVAKRLTEQNAALCTELAWYRAKYGIRGREDDDGKGGKEEELTGEDRRVIKQAVNEFVLKYKTNARKGKTDDDQDDSVYHNPADEKDTLDVGNWGKIQYAYAYLREKIHRGRLSGGTNTNAEGGGTTGTVDREEMSGEIKDEIMRLKGLIKQRDVEIEILTQMVGDGGSTGGSRGASGGRGEDNRNDSTRSSGSVSQKGSRGHGYNYDYNPPASNDTAERSEGGLRRQQITVVPFGASNHRQQQQQQQQQQQTGNTTTQPLTIPKGPSCADKVVGRCSVDLTKLTLLDLGLSGDGTPIEDKTVVESTNKRLFSMFLSGYEGTPGFNNDKKELKSLYESALRLSNEIKKLKATADKKKHELLQANSLGGNNSDGTSNTPEWNIETLRSELVKVKSDYEAAAARLKDLKFQIEALQGTMERSKQRAMTDFAVWYRNAVESVATREKRRRASMQAVPKTMLTGDADVDGEIQAFYALRGNLK